jgi:HCOMODA/2-hydroxy-3-carboxy-muconic semialdehyde decarboxylase
MIVETRAVWCRPAGKARPPAVAGATVPMLHFGCRRRPIGGSTLSSDQQALLSEIVAASRILAIEGVIDSFGHVSARDPAQPDSFLMPRTRAAELVETADILAFDLDGAPLRPTGQRIFAERAIHAAIYRARPDVMAVCHHHAPAMLPYGIAGVPLVPVFHLGATMGAVVPLWDSQAEFGDTDLLVATPDQGASLARALGPHWTVLMRGHGATVAARGVVELTFRCIYGLRNAETQLRAAALGPMGSPVRALTPGEAEAAAEFNLRPFAMDRAWEHWRRRAGLIEGTPA